MPSFRDVLRLKDVHTKPTVGVFLTQQTPSWWRSAFDPALFDVYCHAWDDEPMPTGMAAVRSRRPDPNFIPDLVERRRKNPWDPIREIVCPEHWDTFYAIMRLGEQKRKAEIEGGFTYDICVLATENVTRPVVVRSPAPHTVYTAQVERVPGLRVCTMDMSIMVSDSATFNRTTALYRFLPILYKEVFVPDWDGLDYRNAVINPGTVFHMYHNMFRITVKAAK